MEPNQLSCEISHIHCLTYVYRCAFLHIFAKVVISCTKATVFAIKQLSANISDKVGLLKYSL